MPNVARPYGDSKAVGGYSRVRALADKLKSDDLLTGPERFRMAEIATRPEGITASDAWEVARVARISAGRRAPA